MEKYLFLLQFGGQCNSVRPTLPVRFVELDAVPRFVGLMDQLVQRELNVDGKEEKVLQIISGENGVPQVLKLPEAFLAKGIHSIEIKPVKINGDELMKLLELQLNLVNKSK